ncbi:hypothetical protein EPD60_03030 [Flaviaesturariibacter flavus]|uniref:Uncharacterized protein n=1 Tax=Flaviaesturariibacter flavus TaxID=2502780 RepID=A0A4R1BN34_9BACT|nr:hypothetical protein [Flaviaesturariibacter flavus]TCJ18748.1 hypothetical protein EPD60_03030 [Flaviaesturariibacter flavus]
MIKKNRILVLGLYALLCVAIALFVEMYLFGDPFSWGTVITAAIFGVVLIKMLERMAKAKERKRGSQATRGTNY